MSIDRKSREVVKCCVPSCNATSENSKNTSFYSFPKEKGLKEGWIEALRYMDMYSEIIRDHGPRIISRSFVCSRHFTKEDFKNPSEDSVVKSLNVENALVKRSLAEGAVPSVFSVPSHIPKPEVTKRKVEKGSNIVKRRKSDLNLATSQGTKAVNDDERKSEQIPPPAAVVVKQEFSPSKVDVTNNIAEKMSSAVKAVKGGAVKRRTSSVDSVPLRSSPRIRIPVDYSSTTSHFPSATSTAAAAVPASDHRQNTQTSVTPASSDQSLEQTPKPNAFPKKKLKVKRLTKLKVSKTSEFNSSSWCDEIIASGTFKTDTKLSTPVNSSKNLLNSSSGSRAPPVNGVIAAALNRLNEETPVVKNRPINRRFWISQKLGLDLTTKSEAASPPVVSSTGGERNILKNRLSEPVRRKPLLTSPRRARGRPRKVQTSSVPPPPPVESLGRNLFHAKANPKLRQRKITRPVALKSKPVVLPFRKRLKKQKLVPRQEQLPPPLPQEQRKEAAVVESNFSSAITKVFCNGLKPRPPRGQRKSAPDPKLIQRKVQELYASNFRRIQPGADDEDDEDEAFATGFITSVHGNYEFEQDGADAEGYDRGLPYPQLVGADIDIENDGDYPSDSYDPLDIGNDNVPECIVKVDPVDVNEDGEDEYTTPLLNGFGIVTDDHHDPIPSSLVDVEVKVKTELVVDPNVKMEADEFAILPSSVESDEADGSEHGEEGSEELNEEARDTLCSAIVKEENLVEEITS